MGDTLLLYVFISYTSCEYTAVLRSRYLYLRCELLGTAVPEERTKYNRRDAKSHKYDKHKSTKQKTPSLVNEHLVIAADCVNQEGFPHPSQSCGQIALSLLRTGH